MINSWGSTQEERRASYPCDDVLPEHEQALFRAVSVDAPPPVVFRWLCQLKLVPYSCDLLDNRALLCCAGPGQTEVASSTRDQIAKISSSNATASRLLVGSSTASS